MCSYVNSGCDKISSDFLYCFTWIKSDLNSAVTLASPGKIVILKFSRNYMLDISGSFYLILINMTGKPEKIKIYNFLGFLSGSFVVVPHGIVTLKARCKILLLYANTSYCV